LRLKHKIGGKERGKIQRRPLPGEGEGGRTGDFYTPEEKKGEGKGKGNSTLRTHGMERVEEGGGTPLIEGKRGGGNLLRTKEGKKKRSLPLISAELRTGG